MVLKLLLCLYEIINRPHVVVEDSKALVGSIPCGDFLPYTIGLESLGASTTYSRHVEHGRSDADEADGGGGCGVGGEDLCRGRV
jgi:hypothetical protein